MDLKKLLVPGFLFLALTGCGEGGEVSQAHPGEGIYNRSCFSCHAGGVAGAPVPGDTAAWAPRIAKGDAALLASVKDGMPPGMPPNALKSRSSPRKRWNSSLKSLPNRPVQSA